MEEVDETHADHSPQGPTVAEDPSISPSYERIEDPEVPGGLLGEPPAWEPSPDQAKALADVLTWWSDPYRDQLLTLGGVAGSGKTTIMGKLAYDLISEGVSVKFAAPTGKAVQVLEKSLRKSGVLFPDVSTVHGLMYIPRSDPATGRILGWERRDFVDADLVILDEASMVTSQMLDDLLSLEGIQLLAVGDHGQLPPVGEKVGLMKSPDIKLTKIHRQAKGNPIIRIATIIRNGAPDDAIKSMIEDLADPRVQYTTYQDEGIAFGTPPDGVCITFTNKLRCDINNRIRHELYDFGEDDPPAVDEILVCLKNKRTSDGLVANGMRATIKNVRDEYKGKYSFDLGFDEPLGEVNLLVNKAQFGRPTTFAGFDEVPGNHTSWHEVGALFDFGYAMTAHKFQGSSAPNVAVFVEWALGRLSESDRRRWLYTAVTRASEKLMLVF